MYCSMASSRSVRRLEKGDYCYNTLPLPLLLLLLLQMPSSLSSLQRPSQSPAR
jgi:hypothetical protein